MKHICSLLWLCGVVATAFLIIWMMMELIAAPMAFEPSGWGRSYCDLDPLHRMGVCAIIAFGITLTGNIRALIRRP